MTCDDEKALQRERFREEWFRRTRELRINNSIESNIKGNYQPPDLTPPSIPNDRCYESHYRREDRRGYGPK